MSKLTKWNKAAEKQGKNFNRKYITGIHKIDGCELLGFVEYDGRPSW